MPPFTRRQFRIKATDATKKEPDDEPTEGLEPVSIFSKLPAELQKTVAEYVTRNSDMRSVCRVSKEFHALMLPYLYRDVALHVFWLRENLHEMFTSANQGLSYIQTLRIEDSCTPMFDNSKHLHILCHLLTVIPRNVLRIFELNTTGQVHQDLGLLLRARQQRLTNHQHLRLLPTTRTLTPPSDEISHVSSLQLYLGDERDCDVARQLLERMLSVTSLSLKLSDSRLDQYLGSKREAAEKVVARIFGSANSSHPHRKLKRLRIENMSFNTSGSTLPTVLPLDNLEHLFLFRCGHTDRLCENISHLKLRLKSFCDLRAYGTSHSGAYDTFLKSLQPLHKLRISYNEVKTDKQSACDWSSILPHADELRCLDLRDSDQSLPFLAATRGSLTGFLSFCMNASHLQQLSINGPSLREETWDMPRGLDAFLECVRHLRSLRLITFDVRSGCLSNEDLYQSVYNDDDDDYGDSIVDTSVELEELRLDKWCRLAASEAKVAADHIFASLAESCPRFSVLAIDINEHFGAELETTGFLRSTQTDVLGRTTCVALPIDARTIKYYVTCPEILHDIVDEDLSIC